MEAPPVIETTSSQQNMACCWDHAGPEPEWVGNGLTNDKVVNPPVSLNAKGLNC